MALKSKRSRIAAPRLLKISATVICDDLLSQRNCTDASHIRYIARSCAISASLSCGFLNSLLILSKGRLRRFRNFFAKKFLKTSKNLIVENAFIKAFSGVWGILFPSGFQRQSLWRVRAEPVSGFTGSYTLCEPKGVFLLYYAAVLYSTALPSEKTAMSLFWSRRRIATFIALSISMVSLCGWP